MNRHGHEAISRTHPAQVVGQGASCAVTSAMSSRTMPSRSASRYAGAWHVRRPITCTRGAIAELDLDAVVASGTGTIPVDVRIVIAPEE